MPLNFDTHHGQHGVNVSHVLIGLVIAIVAVLGALQVISTQAQGDQSLLAELSEEIAENAATATAEPSIATPVVASQQSSLAAPLTSEIAPFTASTPASDETPLEKQATTESPPEASTETDAEADAVAEPTETPESDEASTANDACQPIGDDRPYCVYVVQDGDTLSAIAQDLGITSTVAFSGAELIALSNGLNDAQNWLIVPGQELRVPVESGVIHTVDAGETVSVLAELYGVPAAEIIAANHFADPNNVPTGEQIIVPSPSLWPWSGPVASAAAEAPPEAAASEPTEEATAAVLEATATPGAAPLAAVAVPPPSASANPSVTSVRDQFAAGYIAGGGPPQYLEYLMANVIPCESGYNVRAYNPAGPFYGLMQFLPQTWANTGGGDWFDAWQQGHNTGLLLQTASPSTQWPVCWH